MNYDEAVSYINDTVKYGSKNRENFREFMKYLDNPQDNYNIIHIAGTNGKGSSVSYTSHVLARAGYKVGSFVSPYIQRLNERFQVNNVDMPDEDLIKYASYIKGKNEEFINLGGEQLSSFEVVTAIGFLYFSDIKCNIVVLEVGIGGKKDCTNIIKTSMASLIASIGFDHMEILGDTLEKIAEEKAGIIKENGLVFSHNHSESVDAVIKNVADSMNADLHFSNEVEIRNIKYDEKGANFDFKYKDYHYDNLRINLVGRHQIDNVKTVLLMLSELDSREVLQIKEEHIREGLDATRWPGRLERLSEDPRFYIDGAHNDDGVRRLMESLQDFEYDRLIIGIGIMADKDVNYMLESLKTVADIIITTQIDYYRSEKAENLYNMLKDDFPNVYMESELKDAIELAKGFADEGDLIIFCGSLYMVGEVRNIFMEEKEAIN